MFFRSTVYTTKALGDNQALASRISFLFTSRDLIARGDIHVALGIGGGGRECPALQVHIAACAEYLAERGTNLTAGSSLVVDVTGTNYLSVLSRYPEPRAIPINSSEAAVIKGTGSNGAGGRSTIPFSSVRAARRT